MTFRFNHPYIMGSLQVAVGLGLVLSFVSCTDFLKGKPKKQDVITLENKSLECSKNLKDNFSKMFKSELSEIQID